MLMLKTTAAMVVCFMVLCQIEDASCQCSIDPKHVLTIDGAGPGIDLSTIAIDGDLLAVGDPTHTCCSDGVVHTFVRDESRDSWEPSGVLLPSNSETRSFGWSLALQGDLLVVGSDPGGRRASYVHIFRFAGGAWQLEQVLASPRLDTRFGWCVDIDGDVIAVGGPVFDHPFDSEEQGVFIYRFDGSAWILDGVAAPAVTELFSLIFPFSVAIEDDVVVAGSLQFPGRPLAKKAAYVFAGDGGSWVEEQAICSPSDQSPLLVALGGGVLIVEFGNDAFLFMRDQGRWHYSGGPFVASCCQPIRIGAAPGLAAIDSSIYQFRAGLWSRTYDGLSGGQAVAVSSSDPVRVATASGAGQGTRTIRIFEGIVDPRRGTVSSSEGESSITPVLTFGGSPEIACVPVGSPIELSLDAPPLGPSSPRYVLWVLLGTSSVPRTLEVMSTSLGCSAIPTPLSPLAGDPALFRCIRGTGLPPVVCGSVPEVIGPPRGPWTIANGGVGSPISLMIQGIIEDDGAGNPLGFSVTNAVEVTFYEGTGNYCANPGAVASAESAAGLTGLPDNIRDEDPGTFIRFDSDPQIGNFSGFAEVAFAETAPRVTRVEVNHALPGTGLGCWSMSVLVNGEWITVLTGEGNFNQTTTSLDVGLIDVERVRIDASGGLGSLTQSEYVLYELRAVCD